MVQTMTDSIPMIDSILYPRHKAKWEKLDESDDLLVRLHRKFWLDGNYDASMNASELDTDYKTVEPMEGIEDGEGPAEVIEGIAEDNDDVGPECCVLDLETPKPGFSKLWVRKEFFRMYDQCKDHFEAHHAADQSPSVIVTGQPGIGKIFSLPSLRSPSLKYAARKERVIGSVMYCVDVSPVRNQQCGTVTIGCIYSWRRASMRPLQTTPQLNSGPESGRWSMPTMPNLSRTLLPYMTPNI